MCKLAIQPFVNSPQCNRLVIPPMYDHSFLAITVLRLDYMYHQRHLFLSAASLIFLVLRVNSIRGLNAFLKGRKTAKVMVHVNETLREAVSLCSISS